MTGGRTIEELCASIAMSAAEEHGLDVAPSHVGWIVAEFIEGFVNTPTKAVIPDRMGYVLLEIANAARITPDEH